MKFDEKILTYFESSKSRVDKEGYLYKKERASDRDLTGVLVLEGCTVQLCESDEQFAFSLVWSEPGLRTYKFAAEDQESQESWIKALLTANHSYLSLLVMDLEKKYRDTLAAISAEPGSSFTMPNFHTTEAGFSAASQITQTSTLPGTAAPGAMAAGASLTPNLPSKTATKRSPKLWPKRSTNVVPINTPAPPMGEWSAAYFEAREEFPKLHEDFGKEIKKLISSWSRRGQAGEDVQEENLIDFG
ncbi:sesquipedalian-1-like isoform X2 [Solea solea]|uniref:sesquipedalian-1-like isoform X2 n=1 Tax=Solea solea TaxID=90069 RepID=UPI00272C2093|nr:sesquipedalian-1-like isoform X2 [Solea solea]